jgi:hypothetical protein
MLKELIDALIVPKTWQHDRSKTVGASEIGQCERRIWYVKQKHDQDDDFIQRWGASARGDLIEANVFVPALRKKYGDKLKFAGDEQHTIEGKHLSATPDSLLVGMSRSVLKHLGVDNIGSDCLVVECKSIDPRVNLTEAKHQNIMQAQVQMGLIRETTKYQPNYALLAYIDASFHDTVTEFAIAFDEAIFEAAKTRALNILMARSAKELKPEGYIKGGRECEHCPYIKSCGIERHNLPFAKYTADEVPKQFRAEIVDAVRAANKMRKVRDSADKAFLAAQEEIKERLREKGIRQIKNVLSWIEVKGVKRYDMQALAKAAKLQGFDIEKFAKPGAPTSRLTLLNVSDEL